GIQDTVPRDVADVRVVVDHVGDGLDGNSGKSCHVVHGGSHWSPFLTCSPFRLLQVRMLLVELPPDPVPGRSAARSGKLSRWNEVILCPPSSDVRTPSAHNRGFSQCLTNRGPQTRIY